MRNSRKNKKKQIRIQFIDQSQVLPKIQFGLGDKKAMEDLIKSRFGQEPITALVHVWKFQVSPSRPQDEEPYFYPSEVSLRVVLLP